MERSEMGSNNSSWQGSSDAHVCNCIGCCNVCGHCRTDPRHTTKACKKIAATRETIKDALS
jgi:hypothetical protein